MPINPNIALGGQPVQQPNVLGQMGQMMAIRAASQEIEGNEGVRNALSKGMPDDPITLLQYGKQGRETFKSLYEGKAKQTDLLLKNLGITASAFGVIEKNPTVETAQSVFGDLVRMEVMPEKVAQASIAKVLANPTPENIRSLARQGIDYGISAADKLTAQTRLQAANIGASATMRGQDITDRRLREQTEYERANPKLSRVDGENGFYLYNPRDPNSAVPLGMRPPVAAPVAQPSAVNNLMMTTQPTPSVNALTQPAPNQAGPTVAAANALANQPTIIRPKQTIRQPALTEVDDPATPGQKLKVDANVYQQGTTLGAPGVFGVARTEKLTPAQQQKLKGEISKDFEAVERVVGQTNELLESIDAVRSSSLEKVAGPVDARTPSLFKEAQVADARFNNLKGKVTAIAKANASLGGAIGSIANQEWQILANQIAVLDLAGGATANLEQIEQLERQAMSIVARMRDGFERQYGADVETLAPQYKNVPNVNYTPGQYTATGKKNSSVDSTNPWLK